ncbi:MAG: hypothetical protein HZA51_15895 [Planctomycetes bacterium]|nr:hypothetical protein [Planctomycetota bacterium]
MEPLRGWRRFIAWLVAIAIGLTSTYALSYLLCNASLSIADHGPSSGHPILNFWAAFAFPILAMLAMTLFSLGPIFGISIAEWLMKRADKKLNFPRGSCQSCGYNLTGNVSGRCPECGTDVNN